MSWKRTSGRSCTWESVTVQRIISAETYAGVWYYGKEQIPVQVPALVSREIWELAQEKRIYNIKFSKRKMKREYLLRGLIFCGCGRGMVGTNGTYYCTRRYQTSGGEACTEGFVKGHVVESITWGYILGLL